MLFVVSPAKALDYTTPQASHIQCSQPHFMPEAAALVAELKQLSVSEVGQLMSLSDKLAQLNAERFAAWREQPAPDMVKAAALAFNGDVYEGLDAQTLSQADLGWLNQHLRILSGLYGVLRPLDALQAYRLEMGTRFGIQGAANLYQYWGRQIAEHLNTLMAEQGQSVLINLASTEYFKAVDRKALQAPVVECRFEDEKNGQYKVISFAAKRARGLMARWAAEQRPEKPADLQAFASEGYVYAPQCSSTDKLVFQKTSQL